MRIALFLIPAAIAAAFALGRVTSPPAASASPAGHIYTGRINDVFRVPSAAVRCVVSAEGGAPDVLCSHMPRARFGAPDASPSRRDLSVVRRIRVHVE
jgi:hypothetical protein